jgi:hypothetical protein
MPILCFLPFVTASLDSRPTMRHMHSHPLLPTIHDGLLEEHVQHEEVALAEECVGVAGGDRDIVGVDALRVQPLVDHLGAVVLVGALARNLQAGRPSIRLSVCLSACVSATDRQTYTLAPWCSLEHLPATCRQAVRPSVCLSVCQPVSQRRTDRLTPWRRGARWSTCPQPAGRPSVCLSACVSVTCGQAVSPSVCLSACVSATCRPAVCLSACVSATCGQGVRRFLFYTFYKVSGAMRGHSLPVGQTV